MSEVGLQTAVVSEVGLTATEWVGQNTTITAVLQLISAVSSQANGGSASNRREEREMGSSEQQKRAWSGLIALQSSLLARVGCVRLQ